MLGRFYKDRRRAQAGTTLVELLVSLMVIGLALVLIVGTISTGLLNATLAKRNASTQAVTQYELDAIGSSLWDPTGAPYSECFATEDPTAPVRLPYQGQCDSNKYSLRADVQSSSGPTATSQLWTVTVVSWPAQVQVGSPVSLVKVHR